MASSNRRLSTWIGALLAFLCFLAGALQAYLRDLRLPLKRRGGASDLIYLPSPQQARLLSLGFTSVVADYYWVKALQYFTDPSQSVNDFKNLADFLDLVVGLDPDYQYAYKFAGISVPYDAGRLNWKNTLRATSFLERGVQRFPGDWQLHFLLGYNLLNFHDRPTEAAEHFGIAARLPGAPTYLHAFAARVFSAGGALERAIAFTQETIRTSHDPEIVQMMTKRLNDLLTERELQRIERAAREFHAREGRMPKDLRELLAESRIPPPPRGFWLDARGVAHSPAGERMVIHKSAQTPDFEVKN
jgi:hypothetical protein